MDVIFLSWAKEVDTEAEAALVKVNVPMHRMVETKVKCGLVLPVVTEILGITTGSGFAGTDCKRRK